MEPSGEPSGALPHRPDTYVGMVEEQSRLLGVPLDRDELRNLLAYARHLMGEQRAGPLPMLRWSAHYATRRSENPRIRPSQAWADVAVGDWNDGPDQESNSIAVVGTTEDAYEGDF